MGPMQTGSLSPDDELLARLEAPADLSDGVESLTYWSGRRARLPWYRPRARREASRMILVWERRVLAAVVAQRGASVSARLVAARLVVLGPLRRWVRRVTVALSAALVLFGPALVAFALLLKVL
jgi:hypothetical protein